VDGPLGTGEEACLSEGALSLGRHRLTLTATDSDGQSAQATVEAQVGGAVVGEHVLYLPALER